MPKVIDECGFRGIIFPDDHEPAHVHMYKSGEFAIIKFGRDGISVRKSSMTMKDIADALKLVEKHKKKLMKRWREIHVNEN